MRKLFFATILLFLGIGQVLGATRRYYCKMEHSWWTADGAAVGCYAWVGEDESKQENHAWPGVRMTGTGNANEWCIDLDTKYEKVIFTRVNSAGDIADWGAKTENITLGDFNYYTINNTSECWSKNSCACDCSASKYAPTPAIAGSMNSWKPDANVFSGSPLQLTMDLPAGKAYQFKVADGQGSAWYGRNGTYDNDLVFVGQTDAETVYSGEHNLMLMTAEAGTYTFELDKSGTYPTLKITYPSAGNHPSANYVYVSKDASSTNDWGNCFVNFWNTSTSTTLNTDGNDPKLERTTTINDTVFYYVPVLADYTTFHATQNRSGGGYSTGDKTLEDNEGKYVAYANSAWGWHDFSFNVEEHNNGGRVWSDSIGSYTFGVGATLPTCVTKWAYDFDGWYDNEELEGDPVTAISTTDNGDKDYYAKWTSIAQNYPIALHPEFLAAQEGDIIVVNVTGVHGCAAIYLYDLNSTEITHFDLSATGTYTIQLSAAAAAGIRTYGLQVTGTNFTYSDVDILYRKTIWEGAVDATGNWEQSDAISNSLFAGLQAGDFLGVTVNKINENKDSWHTYAIRAAWRTNIISHNMSDPGVGVDILTEALVDSLQNKTIILVSSYLSCTAIHTYTHTRVYDVTLNTNSGTINAGNVTSYTFGTGATLPTDVTRTGHTFAGWYPDAEFAESRVYSISTTDYGAKTYYAKWTVNDYDVTLNTNSGTINDGNVTSYTYGVGATLPTDVTKWGYKFDGWYDNSSFTGDPVTTITTSDDGNKEYWAKWTSISETLLAASGHPEFLAAEEGDILVITVSNVQPSAQIVLENTSSVEIDSKSISATGKYAFQLSASAATALHTGVIITGVNYTKSSVALLYKKTIWNVGVADESGWSYATISDRTGFAGIADGDYLGFTVSALEDPENKTNQYFMQYNYEGFITSVGIDATGTYLEVVPSEGADKLKTGEQALTIGAKYLTLSELNRYITTRDYTVTLNTNSGTINAGNVTSYTYQTGATLPTNVTRDGYNFNGWYANEGLTGDPVVAITTSDYGNKTYWAKWTSLEQTKTPANYSRLSTAEAGDLLVVNVTAISDGSSIKINKSEDGSNLFTKVIDATGKYAFPLSASDATALHTGMILSGTNYTGTVELLLRKTIWHGELESPKDEVEWQTANLTHSDLAGIADGDYVGFTVSAINTGAFHQYNLCAYENPNTYTAANNTTDDAGTYIETIKSGFATHLLDEDKSVFIAAQNLTLTDFYRYLTTRDYTLTLDDQFGSTAFYVAGEGSRTVTYVANTNLTSTFTKPQREGYTFGGYYTAVDGGGTQIIDANGDVVASASDASYTYTDATKQWNYPGNLTVYAKWTDDGDYYFYGGAEGTGTAWATGANWTKGAAPSASTDNVTILKPVTLATGTTKLATVTIVQKDGSSYTPTAGSAITPSGALTIPPTGALVANTIAGATENTLLIESSASGTGALVLSTESHTTGATVQFYTKARKDARDKYINQYFGIPVDSVVKNPTYYGAYLRKFDVENDEWASFKEEKMYGFTAYRIMRTETSEGTYEIEGNLILPGTTTHKDTVLTLQMTEHDNDNMFANSWTAPIDVTKFDVENDFVGTLATFYVFNAGAAGDGTSSSVTTASAGNWNAMPVEAVQDAVSKGQDTYDLTQIPSQQAFLVQGTTGSEHKIKLNYKALVYDPIAESGATIVPTRAPKRTMDVEVELMQLNLSAESGLGDRVLLYLRSDFANDALDNGWEAYKLPGSDFAPQLCAYSPIGEMAIAATNDVEGTVLGFYSGTQDNSYTFSFGYDGSDIWYLNDLTMQQSTRIMEGNTYHFTAAPGSVAESRFVISRTPIAQVPTEMSEISNQKSAVRKIMINGTLFIVRDGRIYTVDGMSVNERKEVTL